ncbi:hypothetical protein TgHK011_007367 [Trichoderma gracile]|nr:hypothetical protein TgHK011_007367 [Trichoderma gracile]
MLGLATLLQLAPCLVGGFARRHRGMELAAPASRLFHRVQVRSTKYDARWGGQKGSPKKMEGKGKGGAKKRGDMRKRESVKRRKWKMMAMTTILRRRLPQTLASKEIGREGAGRLDAKRWCCNNGLTTTHSHQSRAALVRLVACELLVAPEYEGMRALWSSHLCAWRDAQEQGAARPDCPSAAMSDPCPVRAQNESEGSRPQRERSHGMGVER